MSYRTRFALLPKTKSHILYNQVFLDYGALSEKCVVRQFHRCVNAVTYYASKLYGTAVMFLYFRFIPFSLRW
jgi:hypothetical protein